MRSRSKINTIPEHHTHAVIGAGIAGISAALELLAHGAQTGEKGADVEVHLFEALPKEVLFNHAAATQSEHYQSGSFYGARSVRLAGANNAEEAQTIARSTALYRTVDHLAKEHGIYDLLKSEGIFDNEKDPVIQPQPMITFASSQDADAMAKLDQNAAAVMRFSKAPSPALRNNAHDSDAPYTDITPPITAVPPTSDVAAHAAYMTALETYLTQLRHFLTENPEIKAPLLRDFEFENILNQPVERLIAAGVTPDKKPFPRIFMEKGICEHHIDRCAMSVDVARFNQTAIAVMETLYPGKFHFHDGQPVSSAQEHTDGVTITTDAGKQITVEDAIFSTGQYMKDGLEKAELNTEIYAAPYIEFPITTGSPFPVVKGNALPNEEYGMEMEDGTRITLTPKTISRNGAWLQNGVRKGDWVKVQFDEKTPLIKPNDIAAMPSLKPMAGIVAEQIAQHFGAPLSEEQRQAATGRWCPQAIAKNKEGKKEIMAGPAQEGEAIHFFGPGNAHGMQRMGGMAEELAAQIQHRTPRHEQSTQLTQTKTPPLMAASEAINDGVIQSKELSI